MSELSFGTAVAEEVQAEQGGGQDTLAMSMDEFAALEERVLRAVNLVKRERVTRAEAEARATEEETKLSEQTGTIDHLQREVGALRAEREAVKQRVDRLLAELDALEV